MKATKGSVTLWTIYDANAQRVNVTYIGKLYNITLFYSIPLISYV